jgi:hypothetical protein
MQRVKQTKTVEVERGLLLVRYSTADDASRPPRVSITVNPKFRKNIELVLSPDHHEAVLWQPGSCLVVRAAKPGELLVEVIPADTGGSTAATVKIETLSQGVAEKAIEQHPSDDIDFHRLGILGHVAGFGDVVVREDEWIAGPNAPARIEGVSIDWPGKPDDLDIHYSVKLARPHVASGRLTKVGGYAGTRGRALPIVGITLELTGPRVRGLQLSGEAAFLGAPLMRVTGKKVSISGPTGREPLIGFRLRLDDDSAPLQPELPTTAGAKSSARVRVFRPSAARARLRSTMESFLDYGIVSDGKRDVAAV